MVQVCAIHLIPTGASMLTVHTWRQICFPDCLYFINLIFIIKKFMNLTYNPSFISFLQHVMPDWSMLLLYLHFYGHHQCCIIRSCFIYELVTSLKLACLSLQNSRCKYSPCLQNSSSKNPPLPSEFHFKEPPLPLEFQKVVRRGVWIFFGIAHFIISAIMNAS